MPTLPLEDTPGSYSLQVDRGFAVGNSLGSDTRWAAHVKVKNTPDDPIPVYTTSPPAPPEVDLLDFNSISSVASGISTTLYTYTVPPTQSLKLQKIFLSGTNIAQYDIFIDGVQKGRMRSYWSNFNLSFTFDGDPDERGVTLTSGQVLLITVIHNRPYTGDFEATTLGVLIG